MGKKQNRNDTARSHAGTAEAVGAGSVAIGGDLTKSTINVVYQAAHYVAGPLHQLRGVPPDFIGRQKEIAAVVEQILGCHREGSPAISAICSVDGMAGVGKTELANAAGHVLAKDFPDAQLFVPLGTHSPAPLTSKQAMELCLSWLKPESRAPDDEASLRAAYRNAFHDRRCLLILDDARDDDQIASLLPPAGSATIVTSRQHLACSRLPRLDTLTIAEAAGLLQKICPRLTVGEADELAELCSYLPIALTVAGGYLNKNVAEPVTEFFRKLSGPERLKKLKLGERDVNAVFEASYAALTEAQQEGFRLLSVMTASFDRAAALAVIGGEAENAGETLSELLGWNLLVYDEKGERFRWHDLLREFATNHSVGEALALANRRHANHIVQVAWESDRLYKQGGSGLLQGLALFDRERTHMEAAFNWLLHKDDEESHRLLIALTNGVAHTSDLRFHPHELMRWSEAQSKCARLTGDKTSESHALNNLGLAYKHLSDFHTAIDYYNQSLSIAREINDLRAQANILGNLGVAYKALGETRKSIAFHEQALAIRRQLGDRRGEGADLGNLGLAYAALGETAKAIDYYEHALVIARETRDRRFEGTALGNLGIVHKDRGDFRRALALHEQHMAIAREIGDWRGESNALGNMGTTYAGLDMPRRAIEIYEQRLLIAQAMGDRRAEGGTLGNLGLAYAALREPSMAIEYLEQGLVIARETGDKRGEGSGLWNLANVLWRLGNRNEAINRAEASLAILAAMESPDAAMVRAELATWKSSKAIG